MANIVNLSDLKSDSGESNAPELIRISEDETLVVPFTEEMVEVNLHYCEEPEIGGYAHCNESDCVLCRAGKKPIKKYLLPVYMPASKSVGILPLSPSMKPHMLLPQIMAAIDASDEHKILMISRETPFKYTVSTSPLPESADLGEGVISKFMSSREAGQVDLETLYQKIPNKSLEMVPRIKTILELKGVA